MEVYEKISERKSYEDALIAVKEIVRRQRAESTQATGARHEPTMLNSVDESLMSATALFEVRQLTEGKSLGDFPARKTAECSELPEYPGFSAASSFANKTTVSKFKDAAPLKDSLTRKCARHNCPSKATGLISTSDWRLGKDLVQKYLPSSENVPEVLSTACVSNMPQTKIPVAIEQGLLQSSTRKTTASTVQKINPVSDLSKKAEMEGNYQRCTTDERQYRKSLVHKQKRERHLRKMRQEEEQKRQKETRKQNLHALAEAAQQGKMLNNTTFDQRPNQVNYAPKVDSKPCVGRLLTSKTCSVSKQSDIYAHMLRKSTEDVPTELALQASQLIAEADEVEANLEAKKVFRSCAHRKILTNAPSTHQNCKNPSLSRSTVFKTGKNESAGRESKKRAPATAPIRSVDTSTHSVHCSSTPKIALFSGFPNPEQHKSHCSSNDPSHGILRPSFQHQSYSVSFNQKQKSNLDECGCQVNPNGIMQKRHGHHHLASCPFAIAGSNSAPGSTTGSGDAVTQEALLRARLSANRARRLIELGTDSASPSTDDEESDASEDKEIAKWHPLEPSSDSEVPETVHSISDQRPPPCPTHMVNDANWCQSSNAIGARKQTTSTCHHPELLPANLRIIEAPDPLRFMTIYKQKRSQASDFPVRPAKYEKLSTEETSVMETAPRIVGCQGDRQPPHLNKPFLTASVVVEAPPLVSRERPHLRTVCVTSADAHFTTMTKSSTRDSCTSFSSFASTVSTGTLSSEKQRPQQQKAAHNRTFVTAPIIPIGPQRLTSQALNLSLTAELTRLERVNASIEHTKEMESLRNLARIQAESVGLAQILQLDPVNRLSQLKEPSRLRDNVGLKGPSHRDQVPYSEGKKLNNNEIRSNGSTASVPKTVTLSDAVVSPTISELDEDSIEEASVATASDSKIDNNPTLNSISLSISQSAVECINSVAYTGKSAGLNLTTSLSLRSQSLATGSNCHMAPLVSDRSEDKSQVLNTTNDLMSALEALDASRLEKTSKITKRDFKDGSVRKNSLNALASERNRSEYDEPLSFNSEDFKGIVKTRTRELKKRREKAELVLKLAEHLAVQENEIAMLESKALQSLKAKLTMSMPSRLSLSRSTQLLPRESLKTGRSTASLREQLRLQLPSTLVSDVASARTEASVPSTSVEGDRVSLTPRAKIGVIYSQSEAVVSSSALPSIKTGTASQGSRATSGRCMASLSIPEAMIISNSVQYSSNSFVDESSRTSLLSGRSATQNTSSNTLTPVNIIELSSCTPQSDAASFYAPMDQLQDNKADEDEGNLSADSLDRQADFSIATATTASVSHKSDGDSTTTTDRDLPSRSRRRERVRARSFTVVASDVSADALRNTSSIDEVESELASLYANLQKQEQLLSKLDRGCQRAHKDRLARLEKTLIQHKQLCSNIIDKIKLEVAACQSRSGLFQAEQQSQVISLLSEAGAQSAAVTTTAPPSLTLAEDEHSMGSKLLSTSDKFRVSTVCGSSSADVAGVKDPRDLHFELSDFSTESSCQHTRIATKLTQLPSSDSNCRIQTAPSSCNLDSVPHSARSELRSPGVGAFPSSKVSATGDCMHISLDDLQVQSAGLDSSLFSHRSSLKTDVETNLPSIIAFAGQDEISQNDLVGKPSHSHSEQPDILIGFVDTNLSRNHNSESLLSEYSDFSQSLGSSKPSRPNTALSTCSKVASLTTSPQAVSQADESFQVDPGPYNSEIEFSVTFFAPNLPRDKSETSQHAETLPSSRVSVVDEVGENISSVFESHKSSQNTNLGNCLSSVSQFSHCPNSVGVILVDEENSSHQLSDTDRKFSELDNARAASIELNASKSETSEKTACSLELPKFLSSTTRSSISKPHEFYAETLLDENCEKKFELPGLSTERSLDPDTIEVPSEKISGKFGLADDDDDVSETKFASFVEEGRSNHEFWHELNATRPGNDHVASGVAGYLNNAKESVDFESVGCAEEPCSTRAPSMLDDFFETSVALDPASEEITVSDERNSDFFGTTAVLGASKLVCSEEVKWESEGKSTQSVQLGSRVAKQQRPSGPAGSGGPSAPSVHDNDSSLDLVKSSHSLSSIISATSIRDSVRAFFKLNKSPKSPNPDDTNDATNLKSTGIDECDHSAAQEIPKHCANDVEEPAQRMLLAVTEKILNELLSNAFFAVRKMRNEPTTSVIEEIQDHEANAAEALQTDVSESADKVVLGDWSNAGDRTSLAVEREQNKEDDFWDSDPEMAFDAEGSGDGCEEVSTGSTGELSIEELPKATGVPLETVRGLLANTPERTQDLVDRIMHHFWSLRLNVPKGSFEMALRKTTPPADFGCDYTDPKDLELAESGSPVPFVNRRMVFDCVHEFLLRVYAGEDEEVRKGVNAPMTSAQFRLWQATNRPSTVVQLSRLVSAHLKTDLGLNLGHSIPLRPVPSSGNLPLGYQLDRLPKLTQWTLSRKNWLDQLLELEMRAEEPTWLSYTAFEEEIIQNLVSQIFEGLLQESLSTVLGSWCPPTCRSRNPSSVISEVTVASSA